MARPRHTDRPNGPVTYETSFSEGERATISIAVTSRTRELACEASGCERAHGKYATPSHFSRWRLTTATKSHNAHPIVLYMMPVSVCANDATSSEPTTLGRAVADVHAHTTNNCVVCDCGSVRCKNIYQGRTFVSNVTKKRYDVVSSASSMNCATENVVYLISCTRCGVQYVGETSQKLRSRFNNHRNRLKSMANLYLYQSVGRRSI